MGALILVGIGIAILLSSLGSKKKSSMPKPIETPTSSIQRDVEEEILKEERKDSLPETLLRSPFQGIFDSAWQKYVEVQRRGKKTTKTPTAWGIWLIHPQALTDVFGSIILSETWQRKFFDSLQMQYQAFKAHSAMQGSVIRERYKNLIGTSTSLAEHVNLYVISLSGLMGIAHRIGLGGLDKWVKAEKRLVKTDEEFILTNGIF